MSMIVVIAFGVLVLFSAGIVVGVAIGHSPKRSDEDGHFAEAIRLWRSLGETVDELTRRNAVGLGSVRERLDKIHGSMTDDRLSRMVDELIENNRMLERRFRQLQSTLATRAPSTQRCQRRDVNPTASAAVKSEGRAELVYVGAHQQHPVGSHDPVFAGFIAEVANRVQRDMPLDALFEFIYEELRRFIPFQRMGYAEIKHELDRVTSIWHRSERPTRLAVGYSARLSESSLRLVAEQNRIRVLGDLSEYLRRHPNSRSTRLLVEEGFRSSLTCPVSIDDRIVGFLFLTSVNVGCFSGQHASHVQKTASQIGPAVQSAQAHSIA